MSKIYMFSQESMYLDLLDNEVEEIESVSNNIISKLELANAIIIDGTYIVGRLAAFLLNEEYKIRCQEIELI